MVFARHSQWPFRAADTICSRYIGDRVAAAVMASDDWVGATQGVLDELGVVGDARGPFFSHAEHVHNTKENQ